MSGPLWVRCSRCKAVLTPNTMDGSWRYCGEDFKNGTGWEHKCPDADPNCGHFRAEEMPPGVVRVTGNDSTEMSCPKCGAKSTGCPNKSWVAADDGWRHNCPVPADHGAAPCPAPPPAQLVRFDPPKDELAAEAVPPGIISLLREHIAEPIGYAVQDHRNTLAGLFEECAETTKSKGFDVTNWPAQVLLLAKEIGEALENFDEIGDGILRHYSSVAIRLGHEISHHRNMRPWQSDCRLREGDNLLEELADVQIRLASFIGGNGLTEEFRRVLHAKMDRNKERPHLHGKQN